MTPTPPTSFPEEPEGADVGQPNPDLELDVDDGQNLALDEIVYPFAPPQQWVLLCPELTADEVGVYVFVMCHLNPHEGKVDTRFARSRIAERFNRSLDWVDKRLKRLVAVGALSKQAMYWRDAHSHSRGRTSEPVAEDGTKRAQAPNQMRIKLRPPSGPAYPGPIRIAEFYDSRLIERRTGAAQPPAASQRPPSDQGGYSDPSQQGGGAATQRPPQPPHSGPGGRHTAAQKNTGGKNTNRKNTNPAAASRPPLRSGQDLPQDGAGHVDQGVGSQLESGRQAQPACAETGSRAGGSGEVPEGVVRFPAFYAAYPRAVGRPAAAREFHAAVKAGADPEVIVDAARAYADRCQREQISRSAIAYPSVWLREQRWSPESAAEAEPEPDWPTQDCQNAAASAAESHPASGQETDQRSPAQREAMELVRRLGLRRREDGEFTPEEAEQLRRALASGFSPVRSQVSDEATV